ncbi:similar to Saccharomyces cerevisiae YBR111C YSA1 Nudix hydrolase family member with ADP-ribose pyrophosphatase activity [Maudiozyma saulgeensis]|uniref:Similar to Saccharomyces cerevisiae YBR111C YSA1 Nudix hydrolase family member with ADP-ribose pyrophosphatase activity n=1 Tax=Maudiozyma saulgeensis TaxID=1789683 RepID=A0A1X7QX37_9SACH|nr:similar to Saccharomyces cerevisiae YBR111C YSA1 Nudix hydrolase family member with ADP-ribose pyrophosphatase activity [Kazachstania saulgeensis]
MSLVRNCLFTACKRTTIISKQFISMTTVKGAPERAKLISSAPVTDPNSCKWIGLEKLTYTDPNGVQREWDCAVRKTRNSGGVDGIGMLTILKYKDGTPDQVLLQKQFRPPVDGVCIEVPAGLVDANESLETAALRELREETGYIGKITSKSPIIFNDPGFTNTNMSLMTVEVDMSLPENQNPQTQLEDNEFIECFKVPFANLNNELEKLYKQGYRLDARLQNVAHGIEIAKQYNL